MTREEVRNTLQRTPIMVLEGNPKKYEKAIRVAIEFLQERPKGQWIGEVIHTEIGEEHAMQECSVCGKVRIVDNFCPNCGADMRGEVAHNGRND